MKSSIFWDIMLCCPFKVALLASCFMLILQPKDGGNVSLSNVLWLSTDYTALYDTRQNFMDLKETG
jgi:hypothetical protein